MKEHPDYKYRPRRKPKTLVKSPNSGSQANGNHQNNNNNNNNNNDSRSSNNNHHSNHHHSMKSSLSTSPIINSHHHNHHHHVGKYPFVPTIELPITFPSSQHTQQQAFSGLSAAAMHYPALVDPTLALDLQARLQAMYAGVYHPWRYFGCPPLITNSPPHSNNMYATSPKLSPTTTTNSPPLDAEQSISSSGVIWPTPLRFSSTIE